MLEAFDEIHPVDLFKGFSIGFSLDVLQCLVAQKALVKDGTLHFFFF